MNATFAQQQVRELYPRAYVGGHAMGEQEFVYGAEPTTWVVWSDYGQLQHIVGRGESQGAAWIDAATKEKRGTCEKCQRHNRHLRNMGTTQFPFWECGSCQHRRERGINTREMWGRGRRGY